MQRGKKNNHGFLRSKVDQHESDLKLILKNLTEITNSEPKAHGSLNKKAWVRHFKNFQIFFFIKC